MSERREITENEERAYEYMKKSSVLVLLIALLLHLISFGSPWWGVTNHRTTRNDHIGLWKFCTLGRKAGGGYVDHCNDYIDIMQHDWQMVTQAFMTLAMFGILASLGVFAAFVFVPDFQQNFKVFMTCCAMSLTVVLFISIACISWATMYSDWFTTFDPAY